MPQLKQNRTIAWRRPGGLNRAASRDESEPEIVEALRRAGCDVFQLDGRDIPDLLVGVGDRWVLLEVKEPLGPRGGDSKDGQHLSEGQAAFFALAQARRRPIALVRTAEEALRAVGLVR